MNKKLAPMNLILRLSRFTEVIQQRFYAGNTAAVLCRLYSICFMGVIQQLFYGGNTTAVLWR